MTLTQTFIVLFILYIAYVIANAKEDSKLARLGGLDHKWNWILVAIVGLIDSIGIYGLSRAALGLLGFLVPVTWFIHDHFCNRFLKVKNPWTYVGSGEIDKWFKKKFKNKAHIYLYILKGLLLVVCTFVFLKTLSVI